jgi:cytochrome c oxidase assembly protein subunit 11
MALTAGLCAGLFAGMAGLAFAAPPLYRAFCRATGYGGTTQVAAAASQSVIDRRVIVRFDANTAPGLPIEFKSPRPETLRIGETGLVFYRVHNRSNAPVTAFATFNVAPHKTGKFFRKLQCFCFQDQIIPAGAVRELPVVFYVDPGLASDPNTEEVRAITLSYTFFPSQDEAAKALALQGAQ